LTNKEKINKINDEKYKNIKQLTTILGISMGLCTLVQGASASGDIQAISSAEHAASTSRDKFQTSEGVLADILRVPTDKHEQWLHEHLGEIAKCLGKPVDTLRIVTSIQERSVDVVRLQKTSCSVQEMLDNHSFRPLITVYTDVYADRPAQPALLGGSVFICLNLDTPTYFRGPISLQTMPVLFGKPISLYNYNDSGDDIWMPVYAHYEDLIFAPSCTSQGGCVFSTIRATSPDGRTFFFQRLSMELFPYWVTRDGKDVRQDNDHQEYQKRS
jgi:hypothetical protein